MSPSSRRGALASRMAGMRWAGPLVAIILAAMLFARAAESYPSQFGVDFYQIWGVPTAHRIVSASPYVDAAGYARALNAIADASDSAKLKSANRLYRESLVPMATPFYDAVFAFVPEGYEHARLLHTSLLYLAAGLGIFLLARLRGVSLWPSAWIALLVEMTFNPFLQDVRVGNVNSLQLLYVAAMLYIAAKALYPRSAALESLYLGSLAAFVAFKPNTVWIALALAVHYGVARGMRRFALGAVAALGVGLLAAACGAWFFRDAHAWSDWLQCPQGMNRGVISSSFVAGNQSLALILSRHSMAYGPLGYSMIIGGVLAMTFFLALSPAGRRSADIVAAAARCFSDPWCAVSAGVVLTFATSPMVWPHYHVFALVPIFWMLRLDRPGSWGTWGAALCYGVLSSPVIALLAGAGWLGPLDLLTLLSWTLLLPGMLAYAARTSRVPA
jgi:hypothetical protein